MRIDCFFEIHESALGNADTTICKVQNSIILILKVRKLGWIECLDKDVFITLTLTWFSSST